ncbi:MAG: MFS transporter [Desulfatiglans sp.]|nr:MFS transporter [Desulfatiglans sp.]
MKIFLLLLFWTLWYVNFIAKSITSPLMPLIEDEFAITHAMAGVLFFCFWIGNTISVFYAGFMSLKIGYKRSILVSFYGMTIAFIIMRFATSYVSFASIAFLLGLASGIYLPCGIPLITAVFSRDNWGKAISVHETAAGFGMLTVPFMVTMIISVMNWKNIFLIMSAACLILGVILHVTSPDPRPEKIEKGGMMEIVKSKDFWIMTALWSSCAVASMGIFNVIPLFLVKERGIPIETANTIFGISRIGGFIAMISVGFIIDRFNLKKLLFVLLFAAGITTIAIAVISAPWLLSSVLFLQATFSVVFFPAGLVAISRLTTLSERSVFTGILMSMSGIIGPGLSPIVLGAIADRWSFQAGILGTGVIIVAACMLVGKLKEV